MIPSFDLSGVLPPFDGPNVVDESSRSPYEATANELVERFGISAERGAVLQGLLEYRAALRNLGLVEGFQWIGGSYVEDCESIRSRAPNDVDVVTFVYRPNSYDDNHQWQTFVTANINLFSTQTAKADYRCDAYFVELGAEPETIVDRSIYWYGLFSHQRDTARWKGMVQVNLVSDDEIAIRSLEARALEW